MNHDLGYENLNAKGFCLKFLPKEHFDAVQKNKHAKPPLLTTLSIPVSSNSSESEFARFISLGWMVEKPKAGHRITNYAILLCLSTEPASLWLTYDYHSSNLIFENSTTHRLRESEYFNQVYHKGNPGVCGHNLSTLVQPTSQLSSADVRSQLCLSSALRLPEDKSIPIGADTNVYTPSWLLWGEDLTDNQRKAFTGERSSFPKATGRGPSPNIKRSQLAPLPQSFQDLPGGTEESKAATDLADSPKSSRSATSAFSESIDRKSDRIASGSSQTSIDNDSNLTSTRKPDHIGPDQHTSHTTTSNSQGQALPQAHHSSQVARKGSLGKRNGVGDATARKTVTEEKGFMGFPSKFDVALLAPDISLWDPANGGFDVANVTECLKQSALHIGCTPHAETVPQGMKSMAFGTSTFLSSEKSKAETRVKKKGQ